MGTIHLVRHGQAQPDAYGIADPVAAAAAGAPVGRLTEAGVEQASTTGATLAALVERFTTAVSGDLARQTQTLDGVLGAFTDPPVARVDARWNEYELPALMGNASAADFHDGKGFQRSLDAALGRWIAGETPAQGGTETYVEFRRRVADAAADVVAQAGSGQSVLVVSSAGVITQWIAQLFAIPDQSWPALSRAMVNASVTKLIVGRSGVNLVSFNEHLHLTDLATFR